MRLIALVRPGINWYSVLSLEVFKKLLMSVVSVDNLIITLTFDPKPDKTTGIHQFYAYLSNKIYLFPNDDNHQFPSNCRVAIERYTENLHIYRLQYADGRKC